MSFLDSLPMMVKISVKSFSRLVRLELDRWNYMIVSNFELVVCPGNVLMYKEDGLGLMDHGC